MYTRHKAVKFACCMWSFPIGQFVMYHWWDLICYWVFCNNNPQTAALWGNITPSLPTTATLWGNIKPLDIVTALNGQPETVWHLGHCVGVCLYVWEVGEGWGRCWWATLNWHAVPVLVVRPSNYYTHPTMCVCDAIPHIYILFPWIRSQFCIPARITCVQWGWVRDLKPYLWFVQD